MSCLMALLVSVYDVYECAASWYACTSSLKRSHSHAHNQPTTGHALARRAGLHADAGQQVGERTRGTVYIVEVEVMINFPSIGRM